jgi:hypothetical protein
MSSVAADIPDPTKVDIKINPWVAPDPIAFSYSNTEGWTAVMIESPPDGTPEYYYVQAYFLPPSIASGTNPPAKAEVSVMAFDPFSPPTPLGPSQAFEIELVYEGFFNVGWAYPATLFPGNVQMAFVIKKPSADPWPAVIQIQITINQPADSPAP